MRNDVLTQVVKFTPCRLVKVCLRYGGTYCRHLGLLAHHQLLSRNEGKKLSTTLRKIPKVCRSHSNRVRSLKSRNCGSVTFSAISRVFSLCCSHVCWSFQIYENYSTTGKGQEEMGWNPSLVEAVCDVMNKGWTSSVCVVNILTAMNRSLQCASVAGFFQILCCVCSEDTMARKA